MLALIANYVLFVGLNLGKNATTGMLKYFINFDVHTKFGKGSKPVSVATSDPSYEPTFRGDNGALVCSRKWLSCNTTAQHGRNSLTTDNQIFRDVYHINGWLSCSTARVTS